MNMMVDGIFMTNIWVFPTIGVPQNGWFIMENPIKLFLETPIYNMNHLDKNMFSISYGHWAAVVIYDCHVEHGEPYSKFLRYKCVF